LEEVLKLKKVLIITVDLKLKLPTEQLSFPSQIILSLL